MRPETLRKQSRRNGCQGRQQPVNAPHGNRFDRIDRRPHFRNRPVLRLIHYLPPPLAGSFNGATRDRA